MSRRKKKPPVPAPFGCWREQEEALARFVNPAPLPAYDFDELSKALVAAMSEQLDLTAELQALDMPPVCDGGPNCCKCQAKEGGV